MDLSSFKANISKLGGPAVSHRFEISIPYSGDGSRVWQRAGNTPANAGALADKIFKVTCLTAELPGKAFATSEERTYGPIRKRPYSQFFTDAAFTFMGTRHMPEKKFFDSWMDTIQDPDTFDFEYYNKFTTDVTVTQFDVTNKPVYQFKLIEAWPLNIGAIALDWGATNEFPRLTVTMAYRKWKDTSQKGVEGRFNTQIVSAGTGTTSGGRDQFEGQQIRYNSTTGENKYYGK